MAMAALSPSSVLATPIQVNPQVKTDLLVSAPQVDQDGQKVIKKAQTDTVTISSQALKMADDKNADAKKADTKSSKQKDLQLAREKADAEAKRTERGGLQSYSVLG